MTTPTRQKSTVSAQLRKLQGARDKAQAKVNKARREVSEWDAATEAMRAELTLRSETHAAEFEGPQRLPKKGTEAAKLAAHIKKRLREPNPYQAGYEKALGPYLAADRALSEFKRARLHDRLAELEPHHEKAVATIREGLELLKRGCEQYRVGVHGVRAITTDTPGLERRQGMYRFDPGPGAWERLASEALDREILRPGVSEEGEWWASNDG
jgi:hypothetical protein